MKDGTYCYAVEMTVPLGKRNGRLEITLHDRKASGYLTMFTDTQPIHRCVCSGNGISFAGEMHLSVGILAYIAEGSISQSQLKLIFHTDNGDYSAIGRQTIEQRRTTGV